jgi:hemoglobin
MNSKFASLVIVSIALLFGANAHAQATPTTTTSPEPATVEDDLDIPEVTETEAAAAKEEDALVAAETPERDPAAMDPAPVNASLRPVFEQFGGEKGLVDLMDLFMTKLVADPRTKRFFENADQVAVKKHLVEQFCAILGGGCTYTGRDMRSAHKGFDIDRAQFNALVEDLQVAMKEKKIPFRAQNQLLARLAPLHRDIEHR